MGDHHKQLEARLASLQRASPSGDGGSQPGGGGLKERLEALSGISSPVEGREEQFNSRLAALTEERAGGVSSADDLAARFERLGGGVGGGVGGTGTGASAAGPEDKQQYGVPEDCSDEWQDLDDLLEATLDGESPISTKKTPSGAAAAGARVAAGSRGSPEDEALMDGKLSELDALLKSEADAVRGGNRASATVRFEQAGAEANKVMEAFLGERGQGEDEEPDNSARRDHLGHEEERLLEMMTEQVRLEGHGLIARASTPAQEKSDELWLPLAPTAPPVARPGPNNPRNIAARSDSNKSPSRGEAARLLAQQAMDEARLGLGSEGGANVHGRGGGAGVPTASAAAGRGARFGDDRGGSSELREDSWCCICSEDATLKCRECEAENGGGAGEGGHAEPEELFCARCFKEIHREDPDMRAHRPQALSGAGARGGGRSENGGGRRGWRAWR